MDAVATAFVLGVVAVALVLDRWPALYVLGAALVALLLGGVIDDEVALSGFSSTAPVTVAALYVVAGAATRAGSMATFIPRVMAGRRADVRLTAATAAISGFVPNTPLIAMLAPRVVRWCRHHGVAPSRLLMPLSYAGILGGVVTLIGTSTNLVVSDLLVAGGHEPLGLFEMTPVGLPVALAGLLVMSLAAPRVLPDRQPVSPGEVRGREFQVAARVDAEGPLVGRTVADSGLRGLDGVYLAVLERHTLTNIRRVPATPETVLDAGDICCFVGETDRILDVLDLPGLTSLEHAHIADSEGPGTVMFEAVIAPGSSMIGSSLRGVGFRERFGGAVVAIHRSDGSVDGQLGRAVLRAGDVLFVLASTTFADRWRATRDFSLVAPATEAAPPPAGRTWVPVVAAVGLVAVSVVGLLTLLEASLAAAAFVVVARALTASEAVRAINFDVVATIAVSISLGGAVEASGLAARLGGLIVWCADRGVGELGLLAGVMVATAVLTELMSNAAAAAVMIPVGLSAAAEVGLDPRSVAIAILIAASCSFLTPIGYQTNLMVYGLGGYRFTDFARLGAPMTVAVLGTAAVLLTWAH